MIIEGKFDSNGNFIAPTKPVAIESEGDLLVQGTIDQSSNFVRPARRPVVYETDGDITVIGTLDTNGQFVAPTNPSAYTETDGLRVYGKLDTNGQFVRPARALAFQWQDEYLVQGTLDVDDNFEVASNPTVIQGATPMWSPAALFANGERGAWYDPSDLSTMFQDAAGTVPVTGPNQPVRLILDKHLWGGKTLAQFLADQTELVVNGTFDSDLSGWTVNGTLWSWDSGRAKLTASSSPGDNVGQAAIPLGWSRFECDIESAQGYPKAAFVNCTPSELQMPGNGRHQVIVNNTSGMVRLLSFLRTTNPTTCWVDNVSLKSIPGNHLLAPNDASRPMLRNSGALWWLEFDGFDDWLNCGDVLDPLTDNIESVAGVSLVSSQFAVWAKSFYSGAPGRIAMATVYGGNNAAAAAFYAPISAPISGGPTPTSVAGTTKVYSSSVDRTAGTVTLRADGSVSGGVGSFTPDAATSQNTAAVMMIGAHNGGSGTVPQQFHNGNIYGLILRLAPTIMADKARQAAESWMAAKSGVTL